MPIAPHMLAAFAGKKKPNDQIEDDEDDIDELDTVAEDEDEADEEAAEAAEEEAEDEDEDEEEEAEDEEGDEEELDLDAIAQQVEDGEWPDSDLIERAKQVTEETNPPEWVVDEDIWEKAKAAIEERWDEYAEPYAVVAAVYQKMGGEVG